MILYKNTYLDVYNIHEYLQWIESKKRIITRLSKKSLYLYSILVCTSNNNRPEPKIFFLFSFYPYHLSNVVIFAKNIIHRHVCVYFVKLFSKERKFLFHSYLLSVLIISFFLSFSCSLYTYFPLLLKTNFLKKYLFYQHPQHKKCDENMKE